MKPVSLTINGIKIEADEGTNLLQAAQRAGIREVAPELVAVARLEDLGEALQFDGFRWRSRP